MTEGGGWGKTTETQKLAVSLAPYETPGAARQRRRNTRGGRRRRRRGEALKPEVRRRSKRSIGKKEWRQGKPCGEGGEGELSRDGEK